MSRSAATREEYRDSAVYKTPTIHVRSSRSSPVQWSDNSSEEEDDSEQPPSTYTTHVSDHCNDVDNHQRNPAESPVLKRRPLRHIKEDSVDRTYGVTEHRKVVIGLDLQYKKEIRLNYDVLFRKNKGGKERQFVISGHVLLVITVAVFILMGVILFGSFGRSSILNSEDLVSVNPENLIPRVKNGLSKFKNIPTDAAVKFSGGIRNILDSDPNKPAIFVVLYNDSGHGSYCLAREIASLAMVYLGSSEREPLTLNPGDLLKDKNMTNDYGSILEKYKPLIEKHRSTIISDLQNLPGKMAMAFHFFCDTYNPVVEKALFIFTLEMKNVNKSARKIEQVESKMHELWKNDISDDQREPLITRLTEEIIAVPSDIWSSEKCPQ